MKYIDEYRDGNFAKKISKQIHEVTKHSWKIMEICGGQTHAIVKFGIEELLPKNITLVHGPGCPVCVTPIEQIEKAIQIASMPNVIFCSFGDMLRVPGISKNLLTAKASGSEIKIVYSPIDALNIAIQNPNKEIVFFAVGFETTAPANAMSIFQAKEKNIKNYSVILSHVLVPPAIEAILSSNENSIQGFLAAGHVCTVMGFEEYFPISKKYKVPIVVTGFEPLDILQGILICVKQLEEGRSEVENQYSRSVTQSGNVIAQKILKQVFKITHKKWRGIGEIPSSGFSLQDEFKMYDAEIKFNLSDISYDESQDCIAGLVLQGIKKPTECESFGKKCTPQNPLGAPMVSSEGACAAYFNYRKIS